MSNSIWMKNIIIDSLNSKDYPIRSSFNKLLKILNIPEVYVVLLNTNKEIDFFFWVNEQTAKAIDSYNKEVNNIGGFGALSGKCSISCYH